MIEIHNYKTLPQVYQHQIWYAMCRIISKMADHSRLINHRMHCLLLTVTSSGCSKCYLKLGEFPTKHTRLLFGYYTLKDYYLGEPIINNGPLAHVWCLWTWLNHNIPCKKLPAILSTSNRIPTRGQLQKM